MPFKAIEFPRESDLLQNYIVFIVTSYWPALNILMVSPVSVTAAKRALKAFALIQAIS